MPLGARRDGQRHYIVFDVEGECRAAAFFRWVSVAERVLLAKRTLTAGPSSSARSPYTVERSDAGWAFCGAKQQGRVVRSL